MTVGQPVTWVVGSGGLLGSAITRQLGSTFSDGSIPWNDPTQAAAHLTHQVGRFAKHTQGRPWSVIWAAGSATTATAATIAFKELTSLRGLLVGIRDHAPPGPGAFFLTSSAGGVYAGSTGPPFTRDSVPRPLSAYGELKIAQEDLVCEMLKGVVPVTIGRVSNIYGPGQNLAKLQGLISQLLLASVTRQPINIFVPLDTIRDYIYVDDAAQVLVDLSRRMTLDQTPRCDVHIIASGRATTVGQVLQTTHDVTKQRAPVAFGQHPSATAQSPDLRMEPSHLPRTSTPLAAGIKSVHLDILDRIQSSRVHRT